MFSPRRLCVSLIFMVAWGQTSIAQWRGPVLTPLGPNEGLPSLVNRIVTDSTGYIYVASSVGLYRYDGNSFTFFSHDPLNENSLAAGEVLNLLVGSDGLLWIAMRFGGLNSFNPKTGKFKRYPLPLEMTVSEPTINALYEDPGGMLWAGATNFSLLAFDRKSEQFTSYQPAWIDQLPRQARLSILSITPHPFHIDSLWISVLDYKAEKSGFKSYGIASFSKSSRQFGRTPFASQIRYTDTSGIMWGTHWGNFIMRIDPTTWTMDTFVHHHIHEGQDLRPLSKAIIPYRGKLLVASSLALMEFDSGRFNTLYEQGLEGEIYSLFADPHDNLWIGTNQGAQVLNPDDQHIRYFDFDQFGVFNRFYPARLAYDSVGDAIFLSHTLYPHPAGYYYIPLDEQRSEEAVFVPTPFTVEAITIDHHRQLWAVGDGKVFKQGIKTNGSPEFSPIRLHERPIPGILYMSTHASGWIGMIGSREFIWFHPDTLRIQRLSHNDLQRMPSDLHRNDDFTGFSFANREIAYLYSNDVHRVDLRSGEAKLLKYDRKINPHAQRIQFITEDADGFFWMCTYVHTGKYKLEGDSLILLETFGPGQGLISPGASELHIDGNGRVWAFTGSGLQAIDPATREVHVYGTKEGLPFPFLDPVQVLNIAGNRIATVCHNGLIVYDASALWQAGDIKDVPVIFKRMRVNGEDISAIWAANDIRSISLGSSNRGFDIEFQALAYPTDYQMEYSYRILGLQEEWISIGRNQFITLPNLPPGEFTFEIIAGSLINHAPVKSLRIFVAKPLHQQVWFIILLVAAGIAMVFGSIRYRIQRIRRREESITAINKKMAELELRALRSQMNPHFMFNSLNSIKNYILQAAPAQAAEYLSSFAHLIRLILQHSREKVISLREELEMLILYIELEQVRFDAKFEFSVVVEEDIPLEQVMIPPMLLQPFIENAIWHGLMHKGEKGHLLLQFVTHGSMIDCIIDDDGIGRRQSAVLKSQVAHQYKSMGMGITHDRIEIMNKIDALSISTEIIDKYDTDGQPSGTRIIVRIPGPPNN